MQKRKDRYGVVFAVAALMLGLPTGTRAAGDGAELAAAVAKAATAVTSFRETMTGLPNVSSTIVLVKPDRVHLTMSFDTVTSETVAIGSMSYVRINGGTWLVSEMKNRASFAKQLAESFERQTSVVVLPDRQIDGVTYGDFSTTTAPANVVAITSVASASAASAPMTVECSYDKATYLMHACTMQPPGAPAPMTITYSGWNDPQNVVDVPPDAPVAK